MTVLVGVTCGFLLADLGAEVIKVEPVREGDNTRRLMGSGAGYWMTYNRNKKSFAVDIKSEEGMAAVKKLLATADVVTETLTGHRYRSPVPPVLDVPTEPQVERDSVAVERLEEVLGSLRPRRPHVRPPDLHVVEYLDTG